jgi:hypothetical protein
MPSSFFQKQKLLTKKAIISQKLQEKRKKQKKVFVGSFDVGVS